MHKAKYLPLYGICALLIVPLSGCGASGTSSSATESGGAMPVAQDAKEKLDEQRMEEATRGLSFGTGHVVVNVRRPLDRQNALAAYQVAEKSVSTENIWFKAAGLFRDAILLDPTYAPSYEGLARAFLIEGRVDLAETALKTAVKVDPKFGKAHFALGTVTQMKGDMAGAVNIWKELVKRDPSYPDAYARMAVASYFIEDYKSAWTYLDEAKKRKQNVPSQFTALLKEVAPRP